MLEKIKDDVLKNSLRKNYNFFSSKARAILVDKILFVLVIILLGVFRPDALMMGVYCQSKTYHYQSQTGSMLAYGSGRFFRTVEILFQPQ